MLVLLTTGNQLLEIFDRPKTKPEFNFILNQIKKEDNSNIVLYNPRETSVFIINYLRNIKPDISKTMNFNIYEKINNDLNNFWLLCYMPEVNFKCEPNKSNNFKITDIKKTRLVHAYFYVR